MSVRYSLASTPIMRNGQALVITVEGASEGEKIRIDLSVVPSSIHQLDLRLARTLVQDGADAGWVLESIRRVSPLRPLERVQGCALRRRMKRLAR